MSERPRQYTIEHFPSEKQPFLKDIYELREKQAATMVTGDFSIFDQINNMISRKIDDLKQMARDRFQSAQYLQKVPSFQAFIGGSLELTPPEVPADFITDVEGALRELYNAIEQKLSQ